MKYVVAAAANLNMKGASKLEAAFGSHSLILRVVERMQCQVLHFLVVLHIEHITDLPTDSST